MPTLPWEIAAKAALYGAVLVAVGTCAVQSLLLPFLARLLSGERDTVARSLARVRTGAAAAVLLALGLRVLAHTAAVFDWSSVLSWESVHIVAVESRWGTAWQLQVVAAFVFLLVSLWAGAGSAAGVRAWLATMAGVALCYSMPLVGHGAGNGWRFLLHGTHVLGAGLWAGSLVAVMLITVSSPSQRLTLLRGLSPLALSGAGVLGLAGVVLAWSYLGSVSNLWMTAYGQLLSLKLAVVVAAVACGYVNWRRFAAERRGVAWSERLGPVVIEVAFVAVVVLATAALTEVAHP